MSAPPPFRVIFVVTEDWYFLSHRLSLARACRAAGAKVTVICGVGDAREAIEREGIEVIPCHHLQQRGGSIWNMLGAIRYLRSVLRQTPHDAVVNVSILVVLVGTIAALLGSSKRIINILTGLGFMFVSDGFWPRLFRLPVLGALLFFGRFRRVRMVAQNQDDFGLLQKLGFVAERSLFLVRGSGVDTKLFRPPERESGDRFVTFVGRMLESKGVPELLEAARILRGRDYRILLVGEPDPKNPQSLGEEELVRASDGGLIQYWGRQSDVASILRRSAIAVLPSWREGLPKSLLEAAACGLPMIATDVPGCREIVRHEETGLLVPVRDAEALAEAIDRAMSDSALRHRLGRNALRLVETELNEEVVNRATCTVILGNGE